MDLCNPGEIRALLSAYGLSPRKDYGQNFLISREALEDIADACSPLSETFVIEIGPGLGALTRALAARYARVCAVEIDRGLIPLLGATVGECANVEIIQADIMQVDLPALIREKSGGMPVCVCANLPYYITTPILMRLLECGAALSGITVMIQSEVAARLCALPGTADYGAITAAIEYYGDCRRVRTVSAGCFFPAPKVNSAVVRIDLRPEPKYHPQDEAFLFRLIRAAFEQRRKTLPNALSHAFPQLSKEKVAAALEACGHRPDVRGERLSCGEFCRLSDLLLPALRAPEATPADRG